MRLQVFTVYDSKAEAYGQPTYAQAVGAAVRAFSSAANQEGHDFQKFAGDFTLFHVGSFDQETGRFTLNDAPVNLGTALQFLEG